ncbi:MAG: hypothetical protein GXO60_07390 [Epsilonproteobacteria bacterium]|nr:hypothetical protein [Campylobacterota bacterium]
MELLTHDPYLDTIKRTLEDKKYKELYKKEKNNKIKKFMKQELDITNYISLPKGLANMIFFIGFLVVPYIVGIAFIFFIIAQASFDIFLGINIKEYPVYWAIGYEVIATLLLLIIVKSAINFKTSN